jgi:hypothetical protein
VTAFNAYHKAVEALALQRGTARAPWDGVVAPRMGGPEGGVERVGG